MKRKLTAAEKRAKRERKRNTKIIFINGKQKRVPREPTIGGLPVDEFIRRNADPSWYHMNEMWEMIPEVEGDGLPASSVEPWERTRITDELDVLELFEPRYDDWEAFPESDDEKIPF